MQNSKFKIQNEIENAKLKMKMKFKKKSPQLWWGEILVIFNHASGAKILHI